jgi:hypothetical protein
MRSSFLRAGLVGLAGLAAAAVLVPAADSAAPATGTLYVSPGAAAGGADSSCDTAAHTTIQSAVDAAPIGGTVVVCVGTYQESVSIHQRLTLQGEPGAVVDASGTAYGIGIGADHVTVTGMTVKNADLADSPGDGIVTGVIGGTSDTPTVTIGNFATITQNVIFHNAGAGIDVNSSSNDLVSGNRSNTNGIGINVTDDFGTPAAHNTISGNTANDNAGGCGLVLAEHSGAGVFGNVVSGNTADRNGLGTPSAPNASSGSGIILAGGPKGGVHDNLVRGNRFVNNGHGGVAIHSHAPGGNYNGNVITGNLIGTNNRRTDFKDLRTTGIYVGSVDPLSVVITNNLIRDNAIGIFTAGPVWAKGVNAFPHVGVSVVHIASYAG